jgi:hypothetical protein
MLTVRKLTPEEVESLQAKENKGSARSEIAKQYDQFLIEFGPNDHGEVELEEGDSKLNIRNRLRAAAERRGLKLGFLRANGLIVRFKVLSESSDQTSVEQDLAA